MRAKKKRHKEIFQGPYADHEMNFRGTRFEMKLLQAAIVSDGLKAQILINCCIEQKNIIILSACWNQLIEICWTLSPPDGAGWSFTSRHEGLLDFICLKVAALIVSVCHVGVECLCGSSGQTWTDDGKKWRDETRGGDECMTELNGDNPGP